VQNLHGHKKDQEDCKTANRFGPHSHKNRMPQFCKKCSWL
jgi:hypothetical protein